MMIRKRILFSLVWGNANDTSRPEGVPLFEEAIPDDVGGDGDHPLTINLDDGRDHIGSVSVPVEVRK
jgi:hypothetical protein